MDNPRSVRTIRRPNPSLVGVALLALTVGGCVTNAEGPEQRGDADSPLAEAHRRHRVDGLDHRRFQPEEYWRIVRSVVERAPERLRIRQVGTSVEGRPLHRVDVGDGDIPVLLWSQMHGDESTASRALADLFAYLADDPSAAPARRILSSLSVTAVPVLNPDGAARFQRHNALGVDINRDARRQATPEGRALKAVRDAIEPEWAFNLHDQDVRTRLGDTDRDVLVALLAPPPGDGETSEADRRAKHLAAVIRRAVHPVVGDAVARYDESFNPRAFGDLMTRWGAATVLVESGGSLDDPHKERLRTANFVGLLAALEAIASDAWRQADTSRYTELPMNGPDAYDLLLRGGRVVLPGRDPVRADLAIVYEDTLARTDGVIEEVGDLQDRRGLREVDVSELYYLPDVAVLSSGGGKHLAIGDEATGMLARDPEGREIVWRLDDGRLLKEDDPDPVNEGP